MRRKPIPTPLAPPGHVVRFGARILDAQRHDPYQAKGKRGGGARCSQCGAIYRDGRWQWSSAGEALPAAKCPACSRIDDRMPAGKLTLRGPRIASYGVELVRLALNEAEHEREEHPLHRLIDAVNLGDRIELTTTDIHLPQRIGEAIRRAHGGELHINYGQDEYSVLVNWQG